ncbi:hypothetical protein MMC10_006434 [Thelotrema lepadinum]|nr:hypothetical protein [Thelotrema lepadinum]
MVHLLPFLFCSIASLASAQSNVRFGPYWFLQSTQNSIVEATTTLYPGEAQNPQLNRLALWPGMGTSGGDLVQAIILSSNDAQAENCGGKPHVTGQWCVFASTLQNGVQLQGDTHPLTSKQGVTVHYLYEASTGNTTQAVSINGAVVSRLSTNSGLAQGWGTAAECQDECQGVVHAHKYVNTTIRLASANTQFAGTLATNKVCATALMTKDNVTFTVDRIDVDTYTFAA